MTAKKAFTEEVEGANFNLILNTSNDKFIYDDIDIGRDTFHSVTKISRNIQGLKFTKTIENFNYKKC